MLKAGSAVPARPAVAGSGRRKDCVCNFTVVCIVSLSVNSFLDENLLRLCLSGLSFSRFFMIK